MMDEISLIQLQNRGVTLTQSGDGSILQASWIETPLGPMIAIADENFLYLLEFVDRQNLANEIFRLKAKTQSTIGIKRTPILHMIEHELGEYFNGKLKTFRTPMVFLGSTFQKRVWEELKHIPLGETRSYLAIATAIGKQSASRAVAQANRANQLAIVIPCHRVINSNGELNDYAGGSMRKQWLIRHERNEQPSLG